MVDSGLLLSAASRVQYINPEEIRFYRHIAFSSSLRVKTSLSILTMMDGSIRAFFFTAHWLTRFKLTPRESPVHSRLSSSPWRGRTHEEHGRSDAWLEFRTNTPTHGSEMF